MPLDAEGFGHRTQLAGIIDLDEYIFGARTTLSTFLRALPQRTLQLCLPWIEFGHDNLQAQPACVTATNVLRWRMHPSKHTSTGKCLQRTQAVRRVHIHRSVMIHETYAVRRHAQCVCGDGGLCLRYPHQPSHPCPPLANNSVLGEQRVRLHHYKSQSVEHMRARTATGDADIKTMIRNRVYWSMVGKEANKERDTTLAERAVCRGW